MDLDSVPYTYMRTYIHACTLTYILYAANLCAYAGLMDLDSVKGGNTSGPTVIGTLKTAAGAPVTVRFFHVHVIQFLVFCKMPLQRLFAYALSVTVVVLSF